MLPFLTSRSSQLTQEFAFFPTAPPRDQGGIFELRTYELKAGALLEWEHTWSVWNFYPFIWSLNTLSATRRRGIEARREFVAPVGAWFSQVGRLHEVHHMWQYPCVRPHFIPSNNLTKICTRRNLAKRKETREKAWQRDGWAETVSKVTNHIHYHLQSLLILHPTDLTTRESHGLIHTCTTIVQSPQVNEYFWDITLFKMS